MVESDDVRATFSRSRNCDNPTPVFGGEECVGDSTETLVQPLRQLGGGGGGKGGSDTLTL